jgi:hypothetical protein
MSLAGQSTSLRTRVTSGDPRAVAGWCAALVAAALGVGQLLAAQFVGILTWRGDGRTTAAEAAVVVWLAAASVSLGAVAPRLVVNLVPGRRMRLVLPGVAAVGALLTVPVATATTAWSQMYGGELSQMWAVRLVSLGVLLGGVAALVAVRHRATAWSLLCWLATGWVLLLTTTRAAPDSAPILGHLDPGPDWDPASRLLQARLLLIVLAALIGAGLGAAATVFRWGTPRIRRTRHSCAPTPVFAALAGPGLMLIADALAAVAMGQLNVPHVWSLLLAMTVAVGGCYVGSNVARKVACHSGTMIR